MENLVGLVHSSSESNDAPTRNIALKLYNALLVCMEYSTYPYRATYVNMTKGGLNTAKNNYFKHYVYFKHRMH